MKSSYRGSVSRRNNIILSLLSLLILLVGGGILLEDMVRLRLENHARTFKNELEQALSDLDTLNTHPTEAIESAQQHLNNARGELEALRPAAEPVVAASDYLANLPRWGQPVGEVVHLWQFANETTHLGETILDLAQASLTNLKEKGTPGLVAAMPLLQERLRLAEAAFTQAQAARAGLGDASWLPADLQANLANALGRWDALAPRLEETLVTADRLAWMVSALLARDRPMTYLLLIQSSDELRATGGFITGVGTIQIAQGKITEINISEVQQGEENRQWTDEDWRNGVSGPDIFPPPQPMARYMGLGHWVLRDANWWADFPTTAHQAAKFWELAKGAPVDGVIAINAQSAVALLQAIGPINTPDGKLVNADNLERLSLSQIYQGKHDQAPLDQSMLLQELAFTLATLPEHLSPEQLPRLEAYLRTAAARHDLLAASFDPAINTVFQTLGVDGALRGGQDDYLYLVEQNVSYNKLSPFIQQDLQYEVTLRSDGRPALSTLTIDELNTYSPGAGRAYPDGYYNGGRWNPITRQVDRWPGYYGGYTRLYLPAGSNFLEIVGLDDEPDILEENQRTVAGGYVGLQPGAPRQWRLSWAPAGRPGKPGQYRLLVQRQPGAPDHALTVVVYLPAGYRAVSVTPVPAAITEKEVTWHVTLDQDQTFSLALENNGGPAAGQEAELLATPPAALASSLPPQPPPAPPRPPSCTWPSAHSGLVEHSGYRRQRADRAGWLNPERDHGQPQPGRPGGLV